MTGRPPFKPTSEQQLRVRIMAACGMPHDQISSQIINPSTGNPIDAKTLRRAFREELDSGMATANALVAQSLFKKATGEGKGAVTAAIFWLKKKAGWKETQALELTGKDGGPIQSVGPVTPAEVEAIARRLDEEV